MVVSWSSKIMKNFNNIITIFKTNLAFGESCTNQFDWDWIWSDTLGNKLSRSNASAIMFV